jgi:CheY-like chemotaxis protein
MDLEMPVMDGISCVKTIRNLQEKGKIKRHVPVIAVTANARKDQILKSLEAGMVSSRYERIRRVGGVCEENRA